ncbi:MAG TPA: aldehyde dehydrogenase family protein, partial [Novosphingobium sp.]|nr:aldehyde dehydrogenase family protein [Novosphingobium sp.]
MTTALASPTAPPASAPSDQTAAFLGAIAARGLFIGGAWAPPASAETIEVRDPASGEVIAAVAAASAADIDRAVAAARHAFDHGPWPRMAPPARAQLLNRIADGIEAQGALLAELETRDNGMARQSAQAMIGGAAGIFRYYAGWCGKVYGETMEVESWE